MKSSGFGAIRRTSQGASTTAFTTYLNIKDNGGGCPQLEKMDGEHPKKARTYAQVGSASAGMRPGRGLYCVSKQNGGYWTVEQRRKQFPHEPDLL